MSLNKQAKIISSRQEKIILSYLEATRYPLRNKTIFLLSIKAGLRAKEIACLEWSMCLDSNGNVDLFLRLENRASKGKSGRVIPLNKVLKASLVKLYEVKKNSCADRVIFSERGGSFSAQTIVNFFQKLYQDLGLVGCSSHSGRRTFVTRLARNISRVRGSLRDVQRLAGHNSLRTTQMYIEYDEMAIRKVVDLI